MLLITTPNYKGEVEVLGQTAKALGWNLYRFGYRMPEHIRGQDGAVYGEQYFCEIIAEQMGWELQSNSLDWLAKLPERYVSRNIQFCTLAEARKLNEEKFIKPADDKCFPAKVYKDGSELTLDSTFDNIPVLVSDVMKFTSENRCFIKNRKVIAACCYLYKSAHMTEVKINNPDHYDNNFDAVAKFVNSMLEDQNVECADGAVIDVGRFKKDTYAVIETNPVWASGIYGCEIVGCLDAIKAGIKYKG